MAAEGLEHRSLSAARNVREQRVKGRQRRMKYFIRLWAISALAALVALFAVLAVWLFVHLGFGDETTSLILSYATNFRLIMLAVGASVLIGLIEATAITIWQRRSASPR